MSRDVRQTSIVPMKIKREGNRARVAFESLWGTRIPYDTYTKKIKAYLKDSPLQRSDFPSGSPMQSHPRVCLWEVDGQSDPKTFHAMSLRTSAPCRL